MDQMTKTMILMLLVALGGWLATAQWIKSRQTLSEHMKRMLIIPAWFPWMGMAVGAPVAQGQASLFDAFKLVASFSVGMLVCIYMTRRKSPRV